MVGAVNKPDARKHNPDPGYLRELIHQAGLSQQEAARRIGISPRMLRYYLSGQYNHPYMVQHALENLITRGSNDESTDD